MSNSFNPFTPERREKFKCTLFCFRSYVEDAAFFIAIVGIFLTAAFFLVYYREIVENEHHNYSTHYSYYDQQNDSLRLFGFSAILILIHIGIIVGLISRIPGFFAPYLVASAIGMILPCYAFAYSAYYSFNSMKDSNFQSFLNQRSNYKSTIVDWRRFEALNGFVLIGFFLLIQIWVFSIVWRAMNAIKFEKIAHQIAKDQQANRGGTFAQPSVPMMIDVLKPSGRLNSNNNNGHYLIA